MAERLNIEEFFKTGNNELKLTDEGYRGVVFLLDEYHGGKIREIASITRSAMVNYKNNKEGRISKRGRDGIASLANYFNSTLIDASPEGLSQYPDKELMLELKRRGYKFAYEV